jgi:pimeloyl-ACP methyl ester carboxylesterase
MPHLVDQVWHDPRSTIVLTTGIAMLAGAIIIRTLPHGPTTATQTLIIMGIDLVIGLFAGWVTHSRWAVLLTPLAHIIGMELLRQSAGEPSVGALRFDNTFGILAFILGRGFYALIGLLPMVFGASLGAMMTRPAIRSIGLLGWAPTAIVGIGLIALAVVIMLPANTPPILGENGKPVPGSIATLEKVRLGGADQWIMIRAHSDAKPVLLYLSGGPGQSDLPYSRVMFDDLSRDFVVVGWDQRGTGKSYAALDPTSALTLDQAIADTIELTNYLRERFHQQKIYMLGESWGSTLGVLAVQRRPELYYAWIGSGQMVSQRETDRRLYQDMLAFADRTNNQGTASKMSAFGEPPYKDVPYANAFVMGQYDQLYKPYTPPQAYMDKGNAANLGPYGIFASEYGFVEKLNVLRGLIDMFTRMYPQLQGIDFRKDVTRLDVPVYILDGQAELTSRRDLALEWFDKLEAPRKRMFSFENAAHSVSFEQFEAFHKLMVNTVLPETYAPTQ